MRSITKNLQHQTINKALRYTSSVASAIYFAELVVHGVLVEYFIKQLRGNSLKAYNRLSQLTHPKYNESQAAEKPETIILGGISSGLDVMLGIIELVVPKLHAQLGRAPSLEEKDQVLSRKTLWPFLFQWLSLHVDIVHSAEFLISDEDERREQILQGQDDYRPTYNLNFFDLLDHHDHRVLVPSNFFFARLVKMPLRSDLDSHDLMRCPAFAALGTSDSPSKGTYAQESMVSQYFQSILSCYREHVLQED